MTWLTHINIGDFRKNFGLTSFIETGCWNGDGIEYAYKSGFSNIKSCDVNKKYVDLCLEKFPEAEIAFQESLSWLESILPTATEKTLFWLDAHFPDMYGEAESTEEMRIPLIAEIELIKQLKPDYSGDVIVCDDMRTFRSDKNPRYREGELEDHLLLDVDWDAFTNILNETHDAVLLNEHDGVMVFIPKTTPSSSGDFTYNTEG